MDLGAVPVQERTQVICLAAVKLNGCALAHVPEQEKTPELCLAAVQQNTYALEYVPVHLKPAELCRAAVTHRYGFNILNLVPEHLITPELRQIAAVAGAGAGQNVKLTSILHYHYRLSQCAIQIWLNAFNMLKQKGCSGTFLYMSAHRNYVEPRLKT